MAQERGHSARMSSPPPVAQGGRERKAAVHEKQVFPAGTAGHIRSILHQSAFGLEMIQSNFTVAQLKEAREFAQAHPELASAGLWNKTKAATLGRIIRKREKAEK